MMIAKEHVAEVTSLTHDNLLDVGAFAGCSKNLRIC